MAKIEEIREIATVFRNAIDELVVSKAKLFSHYPFKQFPTACCGDMSIILSTHFYELGFGQPDYICGKNIMNDVIKTHAWIMLDNVCIDITADQFGADEYSKVIVEHESNYPLSSQYIPNARASQYQIDTHELKKIYELILKQLDNT